MWLMTPILDDTDIDQPTMTEVLLDHAGSINKGISSLYCVSPTQLKAGLWKHFVCNTLCLGLH